MPSSRPFQMEHRNEGESYLIPDSIALAAMVAQNIV